jgi:hypothetical protein
MSYSHNLIIMIAFQNTNNFPLVFESVYIYIYACVNMLMEDIFPYEL